jgi:hypothetical protein
MKPKGTETVDKFLRYREYCGIQMHKATQNDDNYTVKHYRAIKEYCTYMSNWFE